jgi:hypothetical protein
VVVVVAAVLLVRPAAQKQVTQAVDAGLAQLEASLPPGTTIMHGPVAINPLTGLLTLHQLVVLHDGVKRISADTVSLAKADGESLRDVFDPAAYPQGKPAWTTRRLLLGDFAADGVQVLPYGKMTVGWTIKSVTLHRLSGRPFLLPPTPENMKVVAEQGDVLGALAVDRVAIDGVSSQAGDSQAGHFSIGSFTLSDDTGGPVGAFELKGVSIAVPKKLTPEKQTPEKLTPEKQTVVQLSIGSSFAKNIDLRALSGVVAMLAADGKADKAVSAQMAAIRAHRSAHETHYGLSDVVLDSGMGPLVTLHDLSLDGSAVGGDIMASANTGAVVMRGFTVALGSMRIAPGASAAVAAFGLRAVTLDLDETVHIDMPSKAASLIQNWDFHDLGVLRVKAAVSGYDLAQNTEAEAAAMIRHMTLDSASLTWDDKGLVNRLCAVAAVEMHATPELVKTQLAMPIVTLGLMLPNQPDAAEQVTAFLDHPHELSVTMAPPQKVSFAQIAATPAVARAALLGVHISGN